MLSGPENAINHWMPASGDLSLTASQCSAVQCSALLCKIAQWGYIANNLKHLEWVLLHGYFAVLSTCMILYVLSTSP